MSCTSLRKCLINMKKLSIRITKKEMAVGGAYMAFQLLFLGSILLTANALLGNPLSPAQIQVAYFGINFICTWWIFRRYLVASAKQAIGNLRKCFGAALQGFGLYWIMSFAVVMVNLQLRPDFANINDGNISTMAQGNWLLMSIGTVVLVPVTEEVLFRGILFRGLYDRSRLLAYTVSVLFFSLMHVVSYIGKADSMMLFLSFLQYLPASISLAWTYEKADSIWAPITMHTLVNLISMLTLR